MEVPSDTVARMQELYDAGLYLQAYALAEPLGPFQEWSGSESRILAGRLAVNIGGLRLGDAIHLANGRDHPGDPHVAYYTERVVFGRQGAFASWRRLERWPLDRELPEWLRADWLGLRAALFGRLRDFERAQRDIDAALALQPERHWLHVEAAYLHDIADRYGEALAAAQQALALRPWYRPAVQAAADALVQLGRDDDACALLAEAAEQLESYLVVGALVQLLIELERYPEAEQWLERHEALTPLRERRLVEWMAGRRSDMAIARGDRPRAIAEARKAGEGFYETVAGRMESAAAGAQVVRLPVGFVRQHHMTCAPATLTAMAQYWRHSADHLQVADEICYDGTTSLKERSWAEDHDYVVREFRVTWRAAKSCIDAGIPFALTTFEPGSAHLQAVIGYDDTRGTLLIRDPSNREAHEMLADPGLERYLAQGPRGMVMVPSGEASRLERCELPDAELYDHFYAVQQALDRHDYDGAQDAVARLELAAPGHRLTWQAKATCASYAGNRPAQLEATDRLRKLYPEDPTLALIRLGHMRDLYPRRARIEWLRDRCYGAKTHPGFWRQYAQELMDDGRTYGHAAYWLRRFMRHRWHDAVGWYLQANLWWRSGRRAESYAAYRIAACLSDTDEDFARSYFTAARHFDEWQTALRFLQDRAARHGDKSPGPAVTLAWALRLLDRTPEALRALEEGQAKRPDDQALVLELAELRSSIGDDAGAAELLERVRGRSWRPAFERTRAFLARSAGRHDEVGEAWRRVLEWQPLALDAVRGVAADIERTQDAAAAVDWVREQARRFPAFAGPRVLLAERLGGRGPLEAIAALREAAALDDADAWIRREIVLYLARLGRFDEGFAESAVAAAIEPDVSSWYGVHAELCDRAGKPDDARAHYEQAVRLEAANEFAINELCGPKAPAAEREARCAVVQAEIERQPLAGDGILAWAGHAQEVLGDAAVADVCRRLIKARPECWQPFSVLAARLSAMEDHAAALEVAQRATQRFPMLPRAWVDLAEVRAAAGNGAKRIEALERARKLSPGWSEAIRKLAAAYEDAGEHAAAIAMLTQAIQRDPDNAGHHGWLADACWSAGEREAALGHLQRALELEPEYPWAWRSLDRWATELGEPQRAGEICAALLERHPESAESWLWKARLLEGPDTLDERLAACDRSIALRPGDYEAYDQKAALLGEHQRWDEALAAVRTDAFGDTRPVELRGREGWLLGERGGHAEAIALLEPLMDEAPDYYWAWQRLADYREVVADHLGALQAAQEMVRLSPEHAVAYGYRGHAHRLLEHWTEAKADFTKAVELDPSYDYAGYALFDRLLEEREFDGASAVLERLCAAGVNEFKQARRVQVAVARRDRDAAVAAAGVLFAEHDPGEWAARTAGEALEGAGWGAAAEPALAEAAQRDGAPHNAGVAWMRAVLSRERWRDAVEGLQRLSPGSPAWNGAADGWMRSLTERERDRELRAFLRAHHASLRADTDLWGLGGWALVTRGLNKQALVWLQDWEQREGVVPWMLHNLALAHRLLDQHIEAAAVCEAALRLPADHTTPGIQCWAAADRALAGDAAGARALLDAVDPKSVEPRSRFLHEVAGAVCRARAGDGASARASMDAAWRRCRGIEEMAEEKAFFGRAAWAAAKGGGLGAWWWGLRRWWRSL